MTTALNLIERALLDLEVIEGGGSATAQEASDGLAYLNDLIQSLSVEGLNIYASTTDTFTLTGATSYTYGSGATFNASRPVRVKSAYFTLNGVDYDVSLITKDQYDAISQKTATSDVPEVMYVNYTYPNATVYLYPVASSGSINIVSDKPLTEQATVATVLSMPQGYERMLRLNLAVEMMPQYGKSNDKIIAMAQNALRSIKRLNASNRMPVVGLGLPAGYKQTGNIISGP